MLVVVVVVVVWRGVWDGVVCGVVVWCERRGGREEREGAG